MCDASEQENCNQKYDIIGSEEKGFLQSVFLI